MASKIKSVTIVCQQGTHQYEVGSEHNGLTIQRIEDLSMEFPDSFHQIYTGFTADNERVFEAVDAPVDVEYEKVED